MCTDCYNNCFPALTDKCVKYTGGNIPLFDICTGDPLSKLEDVIVEKLLSALDGTGITPKDVTLENAPELKTLLAAKSPILNNLLQILIDNQKTLKDYIVELQEKAVFVFDTSCLTFPTNVTSPTSDDILQAAVLKLCSLSTTVEGFPTTYVKNTDLPTLVKDIVTGANGNTPIQFNSRLFPQSPVPYIGSLANFDNTGKGIPAAGFEKVYIMNGLNGTQDWRGRAVVGAVRNVPGGTLDASVDPNNANNPNTNYAVGDKFGESFHKLTVPEMAPHSHNVVDNGHSHNLLTHKNDSGITKQPNGLYDGTDNDAIPVTLVTEKSTTGISLGSTGGGLAHNNIQPSVAAVWIVYIP